MKNSNPISLFSFQDIITCLTGIMIVIVLVILLQLVDALTKVTAKSDLAPIYRERQMERDLLREREKELLAHLKELKEEEKKLKKTSEAELAKQIKREEVYWKHQRELLDKTELELEKVREEQRRLKEELESQVRKEKKNREGEAGLRRTQVEIQHLKNEEKRIREEYEKKRKMIHFMFTGLNNRTPLMIECCKWGFRTKVHPDGQVRVFGTADRTRFMNELPALRSYITGFKSSDVYLIFFFREETVPFVEDISNSFESSGYKIGKEVLEKWETCINE